MSLISIDTSFGLSDTHEKNTRRKTGKQWYNFFILEFIDNLILIYVLCTYFPYHWVVKSSQLAEELSISGKIMVCQDTHPRHWYGARN